MVWTVVFFTAVAIVAWLALRNLITVFTPFERSGPRRPGTRPCYAIAFLLYAGACVGAVALDSWWPLAVGVLAAFVFRRVVIWSGETGYKNEIELQSAVLAGDIEQIKSIIALGADVNWKAASKFGATALHEAARSENSDVLRLLIKEGADLNAKLDNGLTPLHVAAYSDVQSAAHILIDSGAQVNAKAKDGVTPLHAAALEGHGDICQLLIDNGANVRARKTSDGLTPRDLALQEGHNSVAEVLGATQSRG